MQSDRQKAFEKDKMPSAFTLKADARESSRRLIIFYQNAQRHISHGSDLHKQCHENLKISRKIFHCIMNVRVQNWPCPNSGDRALVLKKPSHFNLLKPSGNFTYHQV
jgi:hypothetical protein